MDSIKKRMGIKRGLLPYALTDGFPSRPTRLSGRLAEGLRLPIPASLPLDESPVDIKSLIDIFQNYFFPIWEKVDDIKIRSETESRKDELSALMEAQAKWEDTFIKKLTRFSPTVKDAATLLEGAVNLGSTKLTIAICDWLTEVEKIEPGIKAAAVNLCNPDNYNRTVLHKAASDGLIEIASYLLYSGANPDIIDDKDNTAQDYALKKKHPETAKAMQEAIKLRDMKSPVENEATAGAGAGAGAGSALTPSHISRLSTLEPSHLKL